MAMSGTYAARGALTFPASTANGRESLLMADSHGVGARWEPEEYGSTGPDQLSPRGSGKVIKLPSGCTTSKDGFRKDFQG